MSKTCAVDECPRPSYCRSYCRMHYARFRSTGDPRATKPPSGNPNGNPNRKPLAERLDDRWIVTDSGCWEWVGDKRNGYGSVWVDGRRQYAHRALYAHFVAPLDARQVLRHSCDNPPCVNPAHLIAGTQADNNRDMSVRGRWRNQHAVGSGWQERAS